MNVPVVDKQSALWSNTLLTKAPSSRRNDDLSMSQKGTFCASVSVPRKPSAREKRLTLAAGSGDKDILVTYPPTPPRIPLARKDHLAKFPSEKVSRIRQRPSKSDSDTSTHSSSSCATKSSCVEAAKQNARKIYGRRVVKMFLSAFLSVLFGGVGFVAFKIGSDFIEQRDEMIRQTVRDEEFEPLLWQYQQHIRVLLDDQRVLRERLEHSEADRANFMAAAEREHALYRNVPPSPQIDTETTLANANQLELQVALIQVYASKNAQGIQRLSKQILLSHYGPGPYLVEMQLAFPGEASLPALKGTKTGTLLLELATADEMPHTVYTFLSRVDKGLYDGCSFYHNAEHVLAAGTVPNLQTPTDLDLRQRFVEAGLEKLHFQEYHEAWSHAEWTVGIAGRPGGTEFYINLRDNAAAHGPGGQAEYRGSMEPDPSFARVIQGFELVNRMREGPQGHMKVGDRIAILSARIVK